MILGGGSPKNFYLQGQPTLWEVYGIPKGGNDFFIQITTDQVVWGGLSGATPSEAVSWGKVNPGVLPDTVVAYCRFHDRVSAVLRVRRRQQVDTRKRKELYHKREALLAELKKQGAAAQQEAREGKAQRGIVGPSDHAAGAMGTLASELRPIAEELSGAPRVYVDANMPAGVVSFMRQGSGLGRAVRDGARRPAPRRRRRALSAGARIRPHAVHARS